MRINYHGDNACGGKSINILMTTMTMMIGGGDPTQGSCQGRVGAAAPWEGRGRPAPMPLRLEVSGVPPPSGGHSSTKVFHESPSSLFGPFSELEIKPKCHILTYMSECDILA